MPVILGFCMGALLAQNYPPPFPRKDATKVFENDRVEVWDVMWPKGQPTPMHEHPYDQISITLVGGSVRVTRSDGNPTMGKSELGSVALTRKGTVHAEEGMSDVPQHKIMVQLKPSVSPDLNTGEGLPGAFPREGATKVLETDRAIVWSYTWRPEQAVPRHADYLDSVTVFLEGGAIRSQADQGGIVSAARKAGDVVWAPHSSNGHSDMAVSGSPRAIVVELK